MSDRKFQLFVSLLAGAFTIAATVIGVKLQQPDVANQPGKPAGTSPPVSAEPDTPAPRPRGPDSGSEPDNPLKDELRPHVDGPGHQPQVQPGIDPNNHDEPFPAESSLPTIFTLRNGQSHFVLSRRMSVSAQFNDVAGHEVATVVVVLPDGKPLRFPFSFAGEQRIFELRGVSHNVTVLSIDWDSRSIDLIIS